MVKTYLRYAEEAAWGVVASGGGGVAVDASGKLALSPALEAVAVWNIKTGALVRKLQPTGVIAAEVTALELAADSDTLAVGYSNGSILLWRLSDATERVTLNGHKSAVTSLHFNPGVTLLISGARDTNVVVWDVVAEAGICRLRGHKDAVTDVCMLPKHNAIASVSKDGMLRLWDLDTQHCIQTIAAPSGELWSVAADGADERLITGGANAELLVWQLVVKSLSKAHPGRAGAPDIAYNLQAMAEADKADADWRGVQAVQLGPLIVRASQARVARLRFGVDDSLVAVQFADKNLQLYSVQSEAQLEKQLKRRAAKRRKRASGETDEVAAQDEEDIAPSLSAADCYQPLTCGAPARCASLTPVGNQVPTCVCLSYVLQAPPRVAQASFICIHAACWARPR